MTIYGRINPLPVALQSWKGQPLHPASEAPDLMLSHMTGVTRYLHSGFALCTEAPKAGAPTPGASWISLTYGVWPHEDPKLGEKVSDDTLPEGEILTVVDVTPETSELRACAAAFLGVTSDSLGLVSWNGHTYPATYVQRKPEDDRSLTAPRVIAVVLLPVTIKGSAAAPTPDFWLPLDLEDLGGIAEELKEIGQEPRGEESPSYEAEQFGLWLADLMVNQLRDLFRLAEPVKLPEGDETVQWQIGFPQPRTIEVNAFTVL